MRCASILAGLALCACGGTGSALVTFHAAAAGPADAVAGQPLVFTNGLGYQVTLTRACLHIGALYLNRSVQVSVAQATSCILPGIYSGQVTSPLDVDVTSPAAQPFPADGEGTADLSQAAEVWLFGTDVNATADPTTIADVAGTAVQGGTSITFTGQFTISQNRALSTGNPALPGASPLCKQRIVTPIRVNFSLAQGGTLLVRVDPREWFRNVDFAHIPADPINPAQRKFLDRSEGQPDLASTAACARRAVPTSSTGSHLDRAGARDGPALQRRTDVKLGSHITILAACAAAGALLACGSSSSSGNAGPKTCGSPTSGGGVLQPFTAPCTDQGSNAILVTASGELLALGGYGFPPASPDDVAFVDGWAFTFSKVLVTFDHVTLSENPDLSPTDESQTGALVAQADGPWAVDLHKGAPLLGKGGSGEQAVPITAFTGQNKKGNSGFDPAQRYAFGFDIIPATTNAKNVNLNASDLTDYQDMISKGYTALFIGTSHLPGNRLHAERSVRLHRPALPSGGELPPRLHLARHEPQLPEPRQISGDRVRRRGASARRRAEVEPDHRRAGHLPHRSRVLGELRAPRSTCPRRARASNSRSSCRWCSRRTVACS